MFVVPANTPGVDIVRDVGSMDDPENHYGRFGNHAEIVTWSVRIPGENLIGPEARASCSRRRASDRVGSITAVVGSGRPSAPST